MDMVINTEAKTIKVPSIAPVYKRKGDDLYFKQYLEVPCGILLREHSLMMSHLFGYF